MKWKWISLILFRKKAEIGCLATFELRTFWFLVLIGTSKLIWDKENNIKFHNLWSNSVLKSSDRWDSIRFARENMKLKRRNYFPIQRDFPSIFFRFPIKKIVKWICVVESGYVWNICIKIVNRAKNIIHIKFVSYMEYKKFFFVFF